MDWYPDPDETTLLRTPIRFATGFAAPVAGSRWFRDAGRADIQGELPGWPAGPEFTLRSAAGQKADRVAGGLIGGLVTAARVAVEAVVGGNSVQPGTSRSPSASHDHADEVEDFPVMWAAPGARARTVPWQLDPSRRPDRYRVDAVVTDRRLVLLGIGSDMTAAARVLWHAPHEVIDGAEQLAFSEGGHDVRVRFEDGSWVRLATGDAAKFAHLLSDGGPARPGDR